jgi:F0F1-type ATP synthase membrane subunit b/b'
MNINATLLVQMLNFIIAYFILDWLLFKPVMEIIYGEESQKAQADHILKEEEAKYDLAVEQKRDTWSSFQDEFKKEAPHITAEIEQQMAMPSITKEPLLATKEFKSEVSNLASIIEKKVRNVH